MRQAYKTRKNKQNGFSLIEALVAFLILSGGMLGIASLQLISLKAGHTATLRTVAVIKTEEIFERIRSNAQGMASYVVDTADAGDDNGCNDPNATNLCSRAEMARDDIYSWKLDLKSSLPNTDETTASIAVVAAVVGTQPTDTVTVTINWQERNQDTKTMDDMNYSVSTNICSKSKKEGC